MKILRILSGLVLLVGYLFTTNFVSASDNFIHTNVIRLKSTEEWRFSSISELLNEEKRKEVHLFFGDFASMQGRDEIYLELLEILDGKIDVELVPVMHVAANQVVWNAFVIDNIGEGYLIRKTWYDCVVVSRGEKQGVYKIQSLTNESM